MNDLLMYIDQIDQSVSNAEINVLESMIQTYNKSILILEQCEDSSLAEDIFQEGEILDYAKGNKNETMIKRILLFIPRLLKAIAKKLFGERVKHGNEVIDNVVKNSKIGTKFIIQSRIEFSKATDKFFNDIFDDVLKREMDDEIATLSKMLLKNIDATTASSFGRRMGKITERIESSISEIKSLKIERYTYKFDDTWKNLILQYKSEFNTKIDDMKNLIKGYDAYYKDIEHLLSDGEYAQIGYGDLFTAFFTRIKTLNELVDLFISEWSSITTQLEKQHLVHNE